MLCRCKHVVSELLRKYTHMLGKMPLFTKGVAEGCYRGILLVSML